MSTNIRHRLLWFVIVLMSVASVLSLFLIARARAVEPDPLAAALQRAREAGSYHFTSHITQVTVPTSKVTNVGRSSRTDELYLEGQADLRTQSMHLRLWSQQGSVGDPTSGVAIKLEDGKTYVQEGLGAWREQEGITEGFAPQGDFMAYLTALRDPMAHAPEEHNGIRFTRYTFRLDGPTLASYLRDLSEEALRKRGELPPGMQMELPAYYRDMIGDGELWVDNQGLPLRQILRMRFPEQRDEVLQAEIVTNFSEFGQPAGIVTLQSRFAASMLDIPTTLMPMLAVLALSVLLLRQSGRVWRGLALVLIVLLVLNPLLSDLQTARAASAMAKRAAGREQQRAENRQREELLAQMTGPKIDPHVDPLKPSLVTADALASPPSQFFATGRPAPSTVHQQQDSVDSDSDGDGLTDFEEKSVGTDPTYWDTDEDGISDLIEVKGFIKNDVNWFMNANDADSNNDGISDTVEYDFDQDDQPDDTDGDFFPDVFDPDNDGDGVPDAKDLAPFSVIDDTTFTANNPLQLTLENLSPGVPAFVDFQIRPENEEHLWYAYHVLDWPDPDNKGHIQDDDGMTFGKLPPQPGDPTPGASDYNGDMKLVPMLEIRVPDFGANLPAQEDLTPYSISLNEYTEDGSQMVAYVPLSIITDEQTGARVAFNARMRYLPTGSWPTPHELRLVWLVQVLNDMPCDYQAEGAAEQGCAADNYIHNVRQVVHSYSDDWILTGLNLKEDHGSSVAILYEDPDVDLDLIRDEALTALSAGLDQTFLSSRDLDEPYGQRDVDLDEIVRRFDHLSNDGVGEVERWAVPDILRVERQDYPTFDQAVMSTAMTETVRILDDRFAAPWASDQEIKPLLMYAQEAKSRALGMDVMNKGDDWVTWDGGLMTMDLHPSGQEAAPLLVSANLKWTPYCALGSTPDWSPCAMDIWWDTLEARYPNALEGDPLDDPLISDGRMMALQVYMAVLMEGLNQVVEKDNTIGVVNRELKDDNDLANSIQTGFDYSGNVVKYIANEWMMAGYDDITLKQKVLRNIGELKKSIQEGFASAKKLFNKVGTIFSNYKSNPLKATGIGLLGMAVVGSIVLISANILEGNLFGKIMMEVVAIGIQGYLSVIKPIMTIREWVNVYKVAGESLNIFAMRSEVLGNAKGAAVIGAIIEGLITWGFFIYGMIANHVSAFSIEFNQALAETIAATIYLIMMTVLAFTVVGTIIAGIIALIDTILTALCDLGVLQKDEQGKCFTLSGTAIKVLTWYLYNFAPMVNTEAEDLLVLGEPNIALSEPSQGLVDSNSLSASMPVTTTVHHRVPDPADGLLIYPYGWTFFTSDNLASSAVKTTLSSPAAEDVHISRGDMNPPWFVEKDGDRKWGLIPMYRGTAVTSVDSPEISLVAGVNREVPIYLNFAYAFPAYECWGWLFLGVCYVRTLNGNSSSELNTFQLDIFPATLDSFMTMSGDQGSRKLAWDEKFPVLKDADGDGLLASSQDGMDPDDGTWDADGDGLSDTYELEQRQAGMAYSPTSCDIDGDGLTDQQEAQFGTAPDREDTDLDGLLDSDEVVHRVYDGCTPNLGMAGGWEVEITPGFLIWVGSDPLLPDTDGDGVSDKNEQAWAENPDLNIDTQGHPFHPTVPNVPLLKVTAEASPDMLLPGASLFYTTTAVAKIALEPSELDVILPPALGGSILAYTLPFDPLTFTGTQTMTQMSELNVLGDAASQNAIITSDVHAPVSGTVSILNVTADADIRIDADPPYSWIDTLNDWQYLQGDSSMPVITIIGGSADDSMGGYYADSTTGVMMVEVSVNNGPWLLADGTESWTFPLSAMDVGLSALDGALNIRTRAIDGVGNVETPGAGIMVLVDGRPPWFDFQNQSSQPVVPGREASGRWTAPLGGIIYDPSVGGSNDPYDIYAGSGLDPTSLQVRLRATSSASMVIGDWQPVTLDGDHWSLVYQFPASVADPTGTWVSEMRATDKVGNTRQAENTTLLYVDSAAPKASLSEYDIARSVMTGTLTIGGVISDTLSGVDKLDVSFAPLEQVAPLSDAVLWLSFDEPDSAAYWVDRSGHSNDAKCKEIYLGDGYWKYCPMTSSEGRVGGGLKFLGNTETNTLVDDADELNFPAGAGFSVQAWFKSDAYSYGNLVEKAGAYYLGVYEGPGAYWSLPGYFLKGGPDLTDGEWYHIVGTFDPQVGEEMGKMQLFVNGELVSERLAPNDLAYSSAEPLKLNPSSYHMGGVVDEVVIFQHALSVDEVQALYQAGSRPWYPASLAQHGSGITQTNWSVAVPQGLEGMYQIDLRGWDVLGNNRVSANAWRGTIDTWAPRLNLSAESSGAVYIDPFTTERRVSVRYVCTAQDAYLEESSFQCPRSNLPTPMHYFFQSPILHSIFPDLTLRGSLVYSWTQWQPPGVFQPSVRACDQFGNCSHDTWEFAVDLLPPPGPSAAVVSPTDQSIIGSDDGTLNVTVTANAPDSLRQVALKLDGIIVNSVDFKESDKVIFNQREVEVTASEGDHTLVASVIDWAGQSRDGTPVHFTLDTHPPVLGISTKEITQDDVYHKGSPMLRFHGTAGDTLCLATVQLRVGAGPFVDTIFDGITWSVAYFVNAPEGQTLSVTARAIDCAGQITQKTKIITTKLTDDTAPDTHIISTPEDPSGQYGATFVFEAIKGSRVVTGLMCRLDDELFTPCASPHVYDVLSAGQHTFQVRAIDVEGYVDPSPAGFTWTVIPEEQESMLWLPLIQR